MTDRYARLIEQVLDDPGTVLLLGSMDSGKTTFARALLAGAAAERGIDVVAVADINDPALAMAKAEGRAGIVLGMDDNVRPTPSAYDPLADYLLARILP